MVFLWFSRAVAPRVEVPRLDGIPRETHRRRRSYPGTEGYGNGGAPQGAKSRFVGFVASVQ